MSNGEYKSIEHVNHEKERLSIAAFHSQDIKATVGLLLELITEKNDCQLQTYITREVREASGG